MKWFKVTWRTTLSLFETARRFPRAAAEAFQVRRRRSALNLQELERLDRIRNPTKYLGKP